MKKVLVTGASSAVGHYVTQLVTQYGGHVIGTVGSEEKATHAKSAGAEPGHWPNSDAQPNEIV